MWRPRGLGANSAARAIAAQETGAGEIAVGAMEVVGSFKYSEVFKEMIFTFAVVGSGGCTRGFGGGDRRGG